MSEEGVLALEEAQKVGRRVKKMRLARGITQPQMAQYLELSQSNVSNIEIGRVILTLPHLFKLKQLFKCKISDFFEEEELEKKESGLKMDVQDALTLLKLLRQSEIKGL